MSPMTHVTLAALGIALALAGGCFKATFDDRVVTPGPEHEQWRHRFVGGLIGDGEVDVREFCPDGAVARVATGGSLATSLTTIFTLFIYSPRKVYVTCAGSRVAP
jgi:Bor protein